MKSVSPDLSTTAESAMLATMSELSAHLYERNTALEKTLYEARAVEDLKERALAYAYQVVPAMETLRAAVDKTEVNCAKTYWPYPTYGEMLTSV